jgi:hypothetical protein
MKKLKIVHYPDCEENSGYYVIDPNFVPPGNQAGPFKTREEAEEFKKMEEELGDRI